MFVQNKTPKQLIAASFFFILFLSTQASRTELRPGQKLIRGGSPFFLFNWYDGNVRLQLFGCGNLYLTYKSTTLWSPNVIGDQLVMQEDGNLVFQTSDGVTVWESGTAGNPGAFAYVHEDGNLIIYADKRYGEKIWELGTTK